MAALRELLQKVCKIDKVNGCILSSTDGVILDSYLKEGKDDELQAGIGSAKVEKIKDSLTRLDLGGLKQINLYGSSANQCIYKINDNILFVNCKKDANINYISMELEPFVSEINQILAQ